MSARTTVLTVAEREGWTAAASRPIHNVAGHRVLVTYSQVLYPGTPELYAIYNHQGKLLEAAQAGLDGDYPAEPDGLTVIIWLASQLVAPRIAAAIQSIVTSN